MTDSLLNHLTTVDFETEAIGPRPNEYPPKPVGVSFRWPDGRCEYLAWGHPGGDNNCDLATARNALRLAWAGPCLFHNAAFDMEVAYQHMGVPFPREWNDTLFLLFLNNPHATSYSLKKSAEMLLGQAPSEQDAVRDWILQNVPGATRGNFGAHIGKAPVEIVGPYAIGDVTRTFTLFHRLHYKVFGEQRAAYDRERLLLPHLLAAERRGIRVDRGLLGSWHDQLTAAVTHMDNLLRARLNAPQLNVDSNEELADALEREKLISHWVLTDGTRTKLDGSPLVPGIGVSAVDFDTEPIFPTEEAAAYGGYNSRTAVRSMSKKVLGQIIKEKEVADEIIYRNTAATMLRTFVDPWEAMSRTDGRLHTKWHQVRGQDKNGTRTGRIASADPNLANVMNPSAVTPPLGMPFLPSLRMALLPEEGHVWLSADYSQQELRIAGHFEDADIQRAYQNDPKLDLHQLARELIFERTGLDVDRKKTKTVAFATIYGAGITQLSEQMGVSPEEAFAVRTAYFTALPGLGNLANAVKEAGRLYGRVKTLGDRFIPLEPAKLVKGRQRSFDYKLLNHLIQGSAADQTKQSIIDFCSRATPGVFLSQCYDEINLSVPPAAVSEVSATLVNTMKNALPIDVPMEVDVDVGESWGSMSALSLWEKEHG